MANYYVYCENHGRIPGDYSDPNAASRARRAYRTSNPGNHGEISVIEEYTREKYGKEETRLRKFRGWYMYLICQCPSHNAA